MYKAQMEKKKEKKKEKKLIVYAPCDSKNYFYQLVAYDNTTEVRNIRDNI